MPGLSSAHTCPRGSPLSQPLSLLCSRRGRVLPHTPRGSCPQCCDPAAPRGEVSPEIPLPTPPSPSPAVQHPLHHQTAPNQPKSQSRNGIFALRGTVGTSPSDSTAQTAPAGAGDKSPLPCLAPQVFQDYINLCILCFLPGRLCVQSSPLGLFVFLALGLLEPWRGQSDMEMALG